MYEEGDIKASVVLVVSLTEPEHFVRWEVFHHIY